MACGAILLPMHVKHLRRKIAVLVTVVVVMLGIGITVGIRRSQGDAATVEYLDVKRSNFVAETRGIQRMEIVAVPEHSTGEGSWKVLGTMKRASHWFSWASWELAIPREPGHYMQILVRAYDDKGTEMDRVSLPWIGEKALREALWGGSGD